MVFNSAEYWAFSCGIQIFLFSLMNRSSLYIFRLKKMMKACRDGSYNQDLFKNWNVV